MLIASSGPAGKVTSAVKRTGTITIGSVSVNVTRWTEKPDEAGEYSGFSCDAPQPPGSEVDFIDIKTGAVTYSHGPTSGAGSGSVPAGNRTAISHVTVCLEEGSGATTTDAATTTVLDVSTTVVAGPSTTVTSSTVAETTTTAVAGPSTTAGGPTTTLPELPYTGGGGPVGSPALFLIGLGVLFAGLALFFGSYAFER